MRRLLFLLMIVVCSAIVSAELQFTAKFDPSEQTIKSGGTAVYKLTLAHNSKHEEKFDIYSPDLSWDVRTKDFLGVNPSGLTTELYVRALHENEGVFGVPIHITSTLTHEILQKSLLLVIKSSQTPEGYAPALNAEINLPKEIDPRESVVITIDLKNQNRKQLDQVEVKLRSSLINKDYQTSLGPNERKKLVYNFTLPSKTQPQNDILRTTLFVIDGDKTSRFDQEGVHFSIKEYGDVEVSQKEVKGFLTKTKTITLTNTGNVQKVGKFVAPARGLSKFFTKVDPKTPRFEGTYSWALELALGESKSIVIYKNYWSLVLLLSIAAVGVATYSILRSQLVVKKKVNVVSTKEGGILEMKALLYVKNRSQQRVKSVSVLDLVPNLAEYIPEKQLGTISPISVKSLERGTLLKWVIESLEPGEERIIQYRLKNKVAMLSGILLPVAVAKYNVKGILRSVKSNVWRV